MPPFQRVVVPPRSRCLSAENDADFNVLRFLSQIKTKPEAEIPTELLTNDGVFERVLGTPLIFLPHGLRPVIAA